MAEYNAERITELATRIVIQLQEEGFAKEDVLCASFRATVAAIALAPHKDLEKARELYNCYRSTCLDALVELGWK